ncbi:MAG TPA: hypothetical protein VNO30_47640 [Kofleriaceae bacterium]|nr:hypothetical protein [Kofleriaceae bacterium]
MIGHVVISYHSAYMSGESEIDYGEPAWRVVHNSKTTTRCDPNCARWQRDGLEGTPAGEREDNDIAAARMLPDKRERGTIEYHAAPRDPRHAR